MINRLVKILFCCWQIYFLGVRIFFCDRHKITLCVRNNSAENKITIFDEG